MTSGDLAAVYDKYVAMAKSLRQRTAEVAGTAAADRRPVVPRRFCRVFTHYKREEDAAMESGKLDEELSRMSAIAGQITRHSILLCNESFASTNEREGSEIARQVVRAMLRKQIKVFFVTHMYDLARSFHAQQPRQRPFPARRAAAGRAADLQADRGRAAADQLRRGLLPARLRHRRTSGDGRRDGRRGKAVC